MNVRAIPPAQRLSRRVKLTVLAVVVAVTGSVVTATAWGDESGPGDVVPLDRVVPAPVSVKANEGQSFELESDAAIHATAGSKDAKAAADLLAGLLRKPTGFELPVQSAEPGAETSGIALVLGGAGTGKNPGAYKLDVSDDSVTIRANKREGLFNGVATLRQLLPVQVESPEVKEVAWKVQGGQIVDQPRYGYRSAMVDVARNFMPAEGVKRYIDQLSRYKINKLQLHLADDQGWRVEIKSWPKAAEIGGSSGINGLSKGHYTQDQFKDIVKYAWARGITIVPAVEGPDHMHAALASYAKLNCDGKAPKVYEGYIKSEEGLMCIKDADTYAFLDDAIGELAKMTPNSEYIQIGGDETQGRKAADLKYYFKKVKAIAAKHGKKVLGWGEAANSLAPKDTAIQYWASGINDKELITAAKGGAKFVMTPSKHSYLDMKYNKAKPEYPVGNTWAGTISIKQAYEWSPDKLLKGLPASSIQGIEAPLWTETVFGPDQFENLAFPRLLAVAEVGWSPEKAQDWKSFEQRLAAQGPRLREARVNYYLSPEINWPDGS